MPTYKLAEIEAALREARGMVYVAAKRLGCSPNTIKARLEKSEALRDSLTAERGLAGDTAELKLYQAVQNGDAWAIQFYLRTQGRDRGYADRQEIVGRDSGPIEISRPPVSDDTARLLADLLAAGLTQRSSRTDTTG